MGGDVLQVQQACLAAVLDFAATLTHFSLLVPDQMLQYHTEGRLVPRTYRAFEPGFHRKTQNGRAQILHSAPRASFVMRTYGLSPRHTYKHPSVTLLASNYEVMRYKIASCGALPRKRQGSLSSPMLACPPQQHRGQAWQPDLQAIN